MTTSTVICKTFVKAIVERSAVYNKRAEAWNACLLLHTLSFKTFNFPEANQTSILALCLHFITSVFNNQPGLLEHTRIARSLFYLLLITERFLPLQLTCRNIQIYRVFQEE